MMRQDQRAGSPIAIDLPMTPASKRRHDVMRCIGEVWRMKSGSPNTPPRSPISKAFDFLPWTRHKRNMDKMLTDKKEENDNKNVFRNAGLIREILADRSNSRNKQVKNDVIQRHNTVSCHKKGRRLSRNKSLDIDELIQKVDEELKNDNKLWDKTKTKFLDDTFIENIIKNGHDDDDDEHENISPKQNIHPSKHILFNDENTVYFIRKERPVLRHDENTKDKLKGGLKQRNLEENNNNPSYTDGNVIKARLKFKKVPSQDDSNVMKSIVSTGKPSIIYRHNSLDSQEQHSPVRNKSPEIISEDAEVSNSQNDGRSEKSRNKPRKKLSFRDPVVSQKRNEFQRRANADTNHLAKRTNQDGQKGNSSTYDSDLESQAMRIVRTVGQAFEVCHKFNLQKNSLEYNDERSDQSSDILDPDKISEQLSDDDVPRKEPIPVTPDLNSMQRPNHLEIVPPSNNNFRKSPCHSDGDRSPTSPISSTKEIQQLKEQLEQQALQTRHALAQLMLVREQLISETNARIEAQARTQQLLQQNRELLEHLASLGGYTEQNQTGLTSANIALAPQSQLQMLLQEQPELSSPLRKAFLSTANNNNSNNNNNNLTSISQQLNNLGSINQQLSTLSHQLSGLNQQSQNLQNFQNLSNLGNLQSTLQQQQQKQQQQATNTYPTLNQIQNISNKLTTNLSQQQQNHDVLTQKELYQMNQELLNRLQNLNLGLTNQNSNNNGQTLSNNNSNNINNNNNNNNSPQNSFIFANPGHLSSSPSNSNNNFNYLNSPNNLGNLTPSPIGTLNRNSYSNSPMDDNYGLNIDTNLNTMEDGHFIKPLSQVGTLTTLDSDGKVKVIVPISNGDGSGGSGCNNNNINLNNHNNIGVGFPPLSPNKRGDRNNQITNTVMLRVTDESGNITNTRKLSATPSFITRSTSEKVPNRSQMMSQVQRTAWARHTTK